MKYYLIKTDNEPIDNCFEDKVLNWTTNSIMEPVELTEEELKVLLPFNEIKDMDYNEWVVNINKINKKVKKVLENDK